MKDGLPKWIEDLRMRPLKGRMLLPLAAGVWLAGALYCSGYERLLSGIDNWPGSLIWSGVAVLPWLAVFEWMKGDAGRKMSLGQVVAIFAAIAVLSIGAEMLVDRVQGHGSAPVALLLMRRLPAIGVSLLLVIWSQAGQAGEQEDQADASDLRTLAKSIDWIAAADNYIELHIGGRTIIRRMTMREAERALAGLGFIRIHRRFLVNRARIASIGTGERRQSVRLDSGNELPVGRAFAPNLRHG